MSASELFSAGKLGEAVKASLDEVKKQPAEAGLRWRLAELLCFAGDFERADKQLETLFNQFPKLATNVILFRQLVRAENARQQLLTEGRVPEFSHQPGPAMQHSLEALVHYRAGDLVKASNLIQQAEDARPAVRGVCDGQSFDDLRDLDDLCAGTLEVFSGDGKYLWVPFAEIRSLKFDPPERPRDLLWRNARLIASGLNASVFIPVLYNGTCRETDEALRLGRATDWRGGEGEPILGIGQRMWLVGEEQKSIMEIKALEFEPAAS